MSWIILFLLLIYRPYKRLFHYFIVYQLAAELIYCFKYRVVLIMTRNFLIHETRRDEQLLRKSFPLFWFSKEIILT